MEVALPVLPSQHTEYAEASAISTIRHHRLPLQESTGNAQSHTSGANNANSSNSVSGYCSPVNNVPTVSSSVSSTSLPLVPCSAVSSTPLSTITTPPVLPTQSLDRQHNAYHQSQQQQQNFYSAGSLVKPFYQHQSHQPYHHHNHHQQLVARRQSATRHQTNNLSGLAGSLTSNGLLGNSYGHHSLHMGSSATNNSVLALQAAAAAHGANADINPIYLSPQFQAYRKKQGEKDDKTEQIWPDVLEDAFLDALLLIPQMGRKKYAMRGQLHGRNMLISEYLWVAYCLSLPPGAKPDRKMARGRKQVSSHIQVLKNFFIHHRCYHFFFPSKEKKEDVHRKDVIEKESFKDNQVLRALFEGRLPEERPNYEYFGQLLASDALVAIRPSLCWILVSSAAVRFETEGDRRGEAFKSDGLPLDGRMYPHLGLNLKREEWPERGKIIRGTLLQEYTRALSQKEASSVREVSQEWEDRFPGPMMDALDNIVRDDLRDILHFHVTLNVQEPDRFPEGSELNSLVEVTIQQPELQSHRWKSVTRLARPWELMPSGSTTDEGNNDPDQVPVSVITREIGSQYVHRPGCHGVGNGGHCDCIHNSRLRRQQLAVPFPAPEWATMLSMLTSYRKHPLEAEDGIDGSPLYTTTQRSGSFRKASSSKRSSYGSTTTTATATTATSRRRSNDAGDETGDDSFVSTSSAGSNGGPPTQMDLVRNIAMLQELWSCGPSPSSSPAADGSLADETWTRRAVILWTFETVYSVNEKKMEVVKSPAGTGWRFLTTIDPTSKFHQQQALVTPATKAQQQATQHQQQAVQHMQTHQYQPMMHANTHTPTHHQQLAGYPTSRDNIMSPHPGYQQHLNAAMSEHLSGTTWDPTMAAAVAAASSYNNMSTTAATGYNPATAVYRQHHSLSPQAGSSYNVSSSMGLLDTSAYVAGLTTPPPTASLSTPYDHQSSTVGAATNAAGGNNPYTHHPQGFESQLSFMSAASTGSVGSETENSNVHHHNTHRQPSVIDPFLASTGGSTSHQQSAHHHNVTGASGLPDWDAGDMTTALEGWSPAAAASSSVASVTQGRSLKRSRSDSLDNSGFPVMSMPKLNHNGFSSWR
ncbi:hypothetical protein SEPCBS57363_003644 [Sporothrix epigloea]|uniref:TEA domain-containing protein n=1 Tax=Sporothrix epigloea TaxID=1892477 RepID=A0ABP0DML7_9PEZI